MFKFGQKLTNENYSDAATWCAENQATIEQRPDGYYIISQPIANLTYVEHRLLSYPPIPEQLDMLYWDKINGTNLWQQTISNIKSCFPKE